MNITGFGVSSFNNISSKKITDLQNVLKSAIQNNVAKAPEPKSEEANSAIEDFLKEWKGYSITKNNNSNSSNSSGTVSYWQEQRKITSKVISNLNKPKFLKAYTDNKSDSKNSAINGKEEELTKFISDFTKVEYPDGATDEQKARLNSKAIANLMKAVKNNDVLKQYFGKKLSDSKLKAISGAILDYIESIAGKDIDGFDSSRIFDTKRNNDFKYNKDGSSNENYDTSSKEITEPEKEEKTQNIYSTTKSKKVKSKNPSSSNEMGNKIVNTAKKYIGYNSKDRSAQIFIDDDSDIQETAWCSEFAFYAIKKSGQYENTPDWYKKCNKNAAIYIGAAAKEAGAIVNASRAQAGDLLLFDRNLDGKTTHTALIKEIKDGKVYTIERVGTTVKEKSYDIEKMGKKLVFCKITK